jgi:hypothetical protein
MAAGGGAVTAGPGIYGGKPLPVTLQEAVLHSGEAVGVSGRSVLRAGEVKDADPEAFERVKRGETAAWGVRRGKKGRRGNGARWGRDYAAVAGLSYFALNSRAAVRIHSKSPAKVSRQSRAVSGVTLSSR